MLGLLVTMIFNTIGVFMSAEQASQAARAAVETRLDSEVSLLTSLSAYLQANDVELAVPAIETARCRGIAAQLKPAQQLKVLATIGGYDYLAWLLNQDRWDLTAAKSYWAPRMLYALDVAEAVFRYDVIEKRFKQLERFRNELPNAAALIPAC